MHEKTQSALTRKASKYEEMKVELSASLAATAACQASNLPLRSALDKALLQAIASRTHHAQVQCITAQAYELPHK